MLYAGKRLTGQPKKQYRLPWEYVRQASVFNCFRPLWSYESYQALWSLSSRAKSSSLVEISQIICGASNMTPSIHQHDRKYRRFMEVRSCETAPLGTEPGIELKRKIPNNSHLTRCLACLGCQQTEMYLISWKLASKTPLWRNSRSLTLTWLGLSGWRVLYIYRSYWKWI